MSKGILRTNAGRKKTTNSALSSLSNAGANVIVDMKSDESEEEIHTTKGVFTPKRTLFQIQISSMN